MKTFDSRFTPREIFARMQGAWFEPRLGYMWQENTGVTPTTSGGQTIGKLVDLSAGRVASQATAANRPTLQYNGNLPLIRHDSTDVLTATLPAINVRRNLLTYSEQFDNAAWNSQLATATLAGVTATGRAYYSLIVTAGSTFGNKQNAISKASSALTYTCSVYAKAGTFSYLQIAVFTGGNGVRAWYNLTSGAKGASGSYGSGFTLSDYTIVPDVDGFYRCTLTLQSDATSGLTVYINANSENSFFGPVSSGSDNIYISGAQLELGSVATEYQKITDWTSEQYSSSGSVYFSTPQGMSCLHNQSIGTSYNLPALQTDIYGTVITPARLAPPLEQRLALYMHRLAGLSDANFFWQEDYGPDVVTNGGFDTDNAWDKGLGWSISEGVASVVQNSFAQNLTQGCLTAGKVYIITFTITQAGTTSHGIRITLNGGTTFSAYYKTPGTYSFTAAATISLLIFQSLYTDISIDNISAREVLDGQVGQLLADDNDTILLLG